MASEKIQNTKYRIQYTGFTLVELLVVMSIIGVLVTLIAGGFRTAQMRGRDAARKSELKSVSNSLEIFLSDYGQFPSDSGGLIVACPYSEMTSTNCAWGSSEFTDGNTTYFRLLPSDPAASQNYYYRIVPGSSNQKFQLYAHIENSNDQDCLDGDCANPPGLPAGVSCGDPCNFSVTSANTVPTE